MRHIAVWRAPSTGGEAVPGRIIARRGELAAGEGGGAMESCSDQNMILTVNPGAHSTKLGLFRGIRAEFVDTIVHPDRDLDRYERVVEQRGYRTGEVERWLGERGFAPSPGVFSAVVGRGGLMKPVSGGTYMVCGEMLADLLAGVQGDHASNLGAWIAHDIAARSGCPAFVVDPVAVDELDEVARLSGHRDVPRRSLSHALNSRAVAREAAGRMGRAYADCNFVVAHLGSGISVSAHRRGRMVDVNNANEEGPFGPERTGSLPVPGVVRLACDGAARGLTPREIGREFTRRGGLLSYLGTRDVREVEARVSAGDAGAVLVLTAMCYQVAKEIGAMAAVLAGQLDAIVITGAIAHSRTVVELIEDRVRFLAPCVVVPGDMELQAMAGGAHRVLTGLESSRTYGTGVEAANDS